MSSTTSPALQLLGSQRPRVLSAPSTPTSAGAEAVALAELVKLSLYPWQQLVCDVVLRQHADGRYAVLEALLLVSRQNGKGTCIEVIELYGLFMAGANVYHTAHLMATCRKAFKRLWSLISRSPALLRRVMGKPKQTAEQITITLVGGNFVTFMARSSRSGRGFDDADLLILDEALFLEPRMLEATLPAMSTRGSKTPTGPLVLYASSAGVEGSTLLRALRDRVHNGDPTITGLDWSIDEAIVAKRGFDPRALEVVAQANPSLGAGPGALITMDYVRGEFAALSATGAIGGYLRERLGVFDEDPADAAKVIPMAAWRARAGAQGRPEGPVGIGIAGAWPDAEWASIAIAGWLDGELVVQVVDRRPGTGWVVERARELAQRWPNLGVAVDPGGPAGSLIADLKTDADEHDYEVVLPTIRDIAQASSRLRAAIVGPQASDEHPDVGVPYLRHRAQPDLDRAVAAATRRTLGNAWTFAVRDTDVDVSPLEAVNLAAWLVATREVVEIASPVGSGGGGRRPAETAALQRLGF
jgi:hypothetical protein